MDNQPLIEKDEDFAPDEAFEGGTLRALNRMSLPGPQPPPCQVITDPIGGTPVFLGSAPAPSVIGISKIIKSIKPSGWFSIPGEEEEDNETEYLKPRNSMKTFKDDLGQVWDLINSKHALKVREKCSSASLDVNDPIIQAALAPMYNAAGPSFRLRPHQLDGIGMMLKFEESPMKGCLLADDVGSGKMIQILALYLINPMPKPMLVIMPAALINNWSNEIKKFLKPNKTDVLVFGEGTTIKNLDGVKIVLTSYHQLMKERTALEAVRESWGNRRKDRDAPWLPRAVLPLFDMKWGRVVLDESHFVNDKRTNAFRAATGLLATTRILISGTPINNDHPDISSVFSFLKVSPLANVSFLTPFFLASERSRERTGHENIAISSLRHAVLTLSLQSIMIRRVKRDQVDGKYFADMPLPVEVSIQVDLDDGKNINCSIYSEPDVEVNIGDPQYKIVEAFFRCCDEKNIGKIKYERFINQDKDDTFIAQTEQQMQYRSRFHWNNHLRLQKGQSFTSDHDWLTDEVTNTDEQLKSRKKYKDKGSIHELKLILEARLAACHPAAPRAGYFNTQKYGTEEIKNNELNTESGAEIVDHTMIDRRKHFLEEAKRDDFWRSTKLIETVKLVKKRLEADRRGKVIVSCEFLVNLDLLEIGLKKHHIDCLRIDESVPYSLRDDAAKKYQNTRRGNRVMLITSAAVSVSYNLQRATTVIIICPEWFSETEERIISQAYRLGQNKKTFVYRITAKRSIDQMVLRKQLLKKEKISALLDVSSIRPSKQDKRSKKILQITNEINSTSKERFVEMIMHGLAEDKRNEPSASKSIYRETESTGSENDNDYRVIMRRERAKRNSSRHKSDTAVNKSSTLPLKDNEQTGELDLTIEDLQALILAKKELISKQDNVIKNSKENVWREGVAKDLKRKVQFLDDTLALQAKRLRSTKPDDRST